jgi:outer membrane protein TolC
VKKGTKGRTTGLVATAAALWTMGTGGVAVAAERPLSLADAVGMALVNAEGIVIQRESLAAAEAGVSGAEGAFDPRLVAEAFWNEGRLPVNSAFSGAPEGRLAPNSESAGLDVGLEQYLPTGGRIAATVGGDKVETDGLFDLLSPAWESRAGVELRQPLLRHLAIDPERYRIRVAASERAGAVAGLERELSDTVAAVEQAYWSLVAARREVRVREESLRLAGEQLEETQARIETGMAPELEIAQPRAELERRRGELLASRESAMRAENRLKLLVLSDADPALWSDQLVPEEGGEVEIQALDLGAAMARALDSRSEIAALEAVVEERRAATALAANGVKPSLDAVVSYRRYGLAGDVNPASTPIPGQDPVAVPGDLDGGLGDSLGNLADGDFDDARVALVFSVPIGNRAARADAAIAKSAERQAEADLARLRKSIRGEVLDAAATVETAGQRIEAARAAREAARVQLTSEQERYGAGMSTNFLVLTRQNDLSRAWLDEIAAQADYRRARTELSRVTGALLAERNIELAPSDANAAAGVSN